MPIQTFFPSKELEKIVSFYYHIKEDSSDVSILKTKLPTESAELIFHLNKPCFSITIGETKTLIQYQTIIQGIFKNPIELESSTTVNFIGVKLKSNGLYQILRTDISKFYNQIVDCKTIWGDELTNLEIQMKNNLDIGQTIFLIEKFLSSKLNFSPNFELIQSCTRQIIQSKGSLGVNDLAEQTKKSVRHLERLFKEQIGLSPLQFSKIIKTQNILNNIGDKNYENLTMLSLEYDYFDQSHFIKEFKSKTGKTPKGIQVDPSCFSQSSYL